MSATADLSATATRLLDAWAEAMEPWWMPWDGQGIFGCGGGHWGVQAAWRHVAATAVLAQQGGPRAAHWRGRAIAGLRALLAGHASGAGRMPDGRRWGHGWIGVLGIERAWFGIRLLRPHLQPADLAAIDRLLADEAAWLCDGYERDGVKGITSTKWARDRGNHGESNIWNGCFLWRAAAALPQHPQAEAWRQRAHDFLCNGICVQADLDDPRPVGGRPLRERMVGPGFFDHFAFDHHGYLNVGYQVICLSNAAMLHFDARQAGLAAPESLHHHQADLWDVVRRTVFADGRLARIGGDTRVRYAYCQEYLVPAALYAADHLGDGHAMDIPRGWLRTVGREAAFNGDGTFYRRRLEDLAARSPAYWLRLESDRAGSLAQLLAYLPDLRPAAAVGDAEAARAGSWAEPEHGAVLERGPRRLAAFAWRAHGLAQGMCQPPHDGDLAEWEGNLAGRVDFADLRPGPERRKLLAHDQATFAGGFLSWGRLALGCGCMVDEGWHAPADGQAVHHLAVAALPDGRSMIGVELARTGATAALVRGAGALHLNLPNDCLNGMQRTIRTAQGELRLLAGAGEGLVPLASRWAGLAPGWACIGLHGGDTLALDRSRQRRGGHLRSLHVEEVLWGAWQGPRLAQPGTELLDASWLVRCGGDDGDAAACAALNPDGLLPAPAAVRLVAVRLPGGGRYALALNTGAEAVRLPIAGRVLAGAGLELPGHAATLLELED